MKDPLQPPNSYDVLNVPREASDRDVHRAFKTAVAHRAAPLPELQRARETLSDRIERGLLDLFSYSDDQVRQLDPNPLAAPGALAVEHRIETAQRWEDALRAAFPNLAGAHALGVLWYWSARAALDTDEAKGGWRSQRDGWRAAIAYWTHLLARRNEVRNLGLLQPGLTDAEVDEIRRRAGEQWVEGPLRTASGADGRRPQSFRAMYRECLLDAMLERHCTAAMNSASQAGLACGPLLLERLGWLQRTRESLDGPGAPRGDTGEQLRLYLSPHGRAKALVDAGRPEEAVRLVDRPGSGASADYRNLYADAHAAVAARRADVGKYRDALTHWKDALDAVASTSRMQAMRQSLRDAALTRAQTARARDLSDRDEAIAPLRRALEIVPDDENLKQTLAADLLTRARVRHNRGDTTAASADLREAAALGSPEAARILGREADAERPARPTGVPASAQGRADRALACMQRGDWTGEHEHISAAIEQVGVENAPGAWKTLYLLTGARVRAGRKSPGAPRARGAAAPAQPSSTPKKPRKETARTSPPARTASTPKKPRKETPRTPPRARSTSATEDRQRLPLLIVLLVLLVWMLLRYG
ncbi:MAG: hypothetical protein OXH69_10545 [Acidobacteria bacterium]|nr:hypothetical protein [Acidobacteriota bacterium]